MYKYYATQSMYKELSMTSCMEHVHVTWKLHATNSFPKGRSDRTSSRKGPAKYDSSKQPLNPLRILFGRLITGGSTVKKSLKNLKSQEK